MLDGEHHGLYHLDQWNYCLPLPSLTILLAYLHHFNIYYNVKCFEGLKAYKDKEGYIRLFRPELNMQRLVESARRLALPEFSGKELLECTKELLKVDASWIPEGKGYSLYLRPLLIGTQVPNICHSHFLGFTWNCQI